MLAENIAQSPVQQVSNRVVGADVFAVLLVNDKGEVVADFNGSFDQFTKVSGNAVQFLFNVGYLNCDAVTADDAGIADLSAHFGIKRGLIGNQPELTAADGVNGFVITNQCGYLSVGVQCGIAQKFGRTEFFL